MASGSSPQGGDLFIVDSSDSDCKVRARVSEWRDIAAAYFEIGVLLALGGRDNPRHPLSWPARGRHRGRVS